MNQTTCSTLPDGELFCLRQTDVPFYYSTKPELIAGIPDTYITLATPIIAYWVLSLFFHALDVSEWKWLDKYRIHDSVETQSKNRVTKTQVVWAVIFQQVIQTILGLWFLDEDHHHLADHTSKVSAYADRLLPLIENRSVAETLAYAVYWWFIPVGQLLAAACVPSSHIAVFFQNVHDSIGSSLTLGNTSFTALCM